MQIAEDIIVDKNNSSTTALGDANGDNLNIDAKLIITALQRLLDIKQNCS